MRLSPYLRTGFPTPTDPVIHLINSARIVQKSAISSLSEGLDEQLFQLDEAREYMAAGMTLADACRVVGDVLGQSIPLSGVSLFGLDETRTAIELLRSSYPAAGHGAPSTTAYECFRTGSRCGDGRNISIPLRRSTNIFGVLELHLERETILQNNAVEAIGERVAPLILIALSNEKNRRNAAIDLLTSLPNERMFYQVTAECIAHGVAPMLLIADIVTLDETNLRYGHATGDHLLQATAAALKTGIRDIDRLARSTGSEFLILIPRSAGIDIATIIKRLTRSVTSVELVVTAGEKANPRVEFGWAMYGDDGDTAEQLLKTARTRLVMQPSNQRDSKVIEFPRKLEK